MNKTKIAYAGGRALGVQALQWLSSQERFEVVAVCPVPKQYDPDYYESMMDVVNNKGYRIFEINELLGLEIDIGLSVNYHRIIKEDILCHCTKGFYNVHHSYNLRLRGRNITTHAILNTLNDNIYYHGTTIHQMAPELDSGGIVASEAVNIEKSDTAYSLFKKTDEKALALIKEWVPRIAFEKVITYEPPKEMIHMYRNSDLPERIIKESLSGNQINALIRAFDFPGKEPAYMIIDGKKIHLVFHERGQYKKPYSVKGETYYTE